uniref:Methyltransferase domain-containing protein n=1 Tax=Noctiluca scintillans TaxID=2966 RepID=A0A7S1B2F9_NOCSC
MPELAVSTDVGRNVPVAAAAALAAGGAAIGLVIGVLAGARKSTSWFARRASEPQRPGDMCECGVLLSPTWSAAEAAEHRNSKRHKTNIRALGNTRIVVCEEVGEYRAAAIKLVDATDRVLEVGSHVGGTTKVLAGLGCRLIGLDQQAMLVEQARVNLPHVQFEVADAFDASRVMALAASLEPANFTKVFIDISGSRDLSTVARLIVMYQNTLKPEVLIVKSQTLKRLLMRSTLWVDDPLNQIFDDNK